MGIRIYGGDNLTLADPMGVSIATAAEISTLSVSRGWIMKTDVNDIAFRGTSGWWKFTPTQTGVVNFDVGLSYSLFTGRTTTSLPDLDVTIYTGTVGATTISDLHYLDSSDFGTYQDGLLAGQQTRLGSLPYLVEGGQQYYISVAEQNSQANTIVYLRVSGYGDVGSWNVPAQVTVQVLPPVGASESTYHPLSYGPGLISPSIYGPSYFGNYQLSRAFAGYPASNPSDPTPWPAGPQCAWHYGRQGNFGSQWWSKYGGNGPPAGSGLHTYTWNGTDPYDSSIAGFGTCRVYFGGIPVVDSYPGGNGTTGIQFIADEDTLGFFYYQDTYMRSFGTSQYTSVTKIVDALNLTNAGVVLPPFSADVFTIQVEEADVEIVDFQYAFDEYAGDITHTGYTEWFLDVVTSGDDTEAGLWGPNRDGTNSMFWQGGGDGPEGFDARSTNLGSYLGGFDNWRSLDPAKVAAAIAAERAWTDAHVQPYSLRWVGFHPSMKNETLPVEIAPFDYTNGSKTSSRVAQHVAIQVTVQPRSYRYAYLPEIPEVTEITGAISGLQDINRAVFRYRGTG